MKDFEKRLQDAINYKNADNGETFYRLVARQNGRTAMMNFGQSPSKTINIFVDMVTEMCKSLKMPGFGAAYALDDGNLLFKFKRTSPNGVVVQVLDRSFSIFEILYVSGSFYPIVKQLEKEIVEGFKIEQYQERVHKLRGFEAAISIHDDILELFKLKDLGDV